MQTSNDKKNILGERIKERCKANKITQKMLAESVGLGPRQMNRIVRGNNKKSINLHYLMLWALRLQTSVEYLTGQTDDPTRSKAQSGEKISLAEDYLKIKNNSRVAMQSNAHLAEDHEQESIDDHDQIIVPVLSPEQTACCGRGIPCMDITSDFGERVSVPLHDVGRFCEGRMPFAVIADGQSMEKWKIYDGSRVVINPVEEVHDFDIALVCYRDNLVLKKLQRLQNGNINLISADGAIITVPADEANVPALFSIWGKAMTISYTSRVQHGL